eukprot:2794728-Rhodomonas_salina.6
MSRTGSLYATPCPVLTKRMVLQDATECWASATVVLLTHCYYNCYSPYYCLQCYLLRAAVGTSCWLLCYARARPRPVLTYGGCQVTFALGSIAAREFTEKAQVFFAANLSNSDQ